MLEITNIEKLAEKLANSQNILIGIGPDFLFDELAAGLSLGLSLEKAGKKITIFSTKLPQVAQASLFGISKISNTLNSGNLVISIPDALNLVDKVTHYLEGETLNIVVHPLAGNPNLSEEKITIKTLQNSPDLIILVNTTWLQLQDKLSTQEQKIYSEVPKVIVGKVFDYQGDDIPISSSESASLSEIIFWILRKLELPMDADCASNLFQGMEFATRFAPPQATVSTFEAAAICLSTKPVLPKIGEDANLQPTIGQQKLANVQNQSNKTFRQEPKNGDVFKDQSTNLEESFQKDAGRIQSDWLVPKIFKSSSIQSKKT